MYTVVVLLIIGLFLVKYLPSMFGKGKKNETRKMWSKIIGSVMILLSVLTIINQIFDLIE
jgi:hypothetical protein